MTGRAHKAKTTEHMPRAEHIFRQVNPVRGHAPRQRYIARNQQEMAVFMGDGP